MIPLLYIVAALVGLFSLFWMITYNGFVLRRNRAKNAYSSIDIQLKKRWELIPNLVETAKGYAKHEKALFERITQARQQAMSLNEANAERFDNEAIMTQNLPRLVALSEAYPELKADKHFVNLQRNLTEIESQISAARRSYNAAVEELNISVKSFPSSIVANTHKIEEMFFFSIDKAEKAAVQLRV